MSKIIALSKKVCIFRTASFEDFFVGVVVKYLKEPEGDDQSIFVFL